MDSSSSPERDSAGTEEDEAGTEVEVPGNTGFEQHTPATYLLILYFARQVRRKHDAGASDEADEADGSDHIVFDGIIDNVSPHPRFVDRYHGAAQLKVSLLVAENLGTPVPFTVSVNRSTGKISNLYAEFPALGEPMKSLEISFPEEL